MTLKAFAEKYKVSYTLVIEASAKVPHIATMERDMDYSEKDLYEAVLDKLECKRDKAMHKAEVYINPINHMLFARKEHGYEKV